MAQSFSNAILRKQNQIFRGTGSVSEKNRSQGFIPTFYDSKSHQAHISRFANGTPVPIHILDGFLKSGSSNAIPQAGLWL
jgi:hypothetical protein